MRELTEEYYDRGAEAVSWRPCYDMACRSFILCRFLIIIGDAACIAISCRVIDKMTAADALAAMVRSTSGSAAAFLSALAIRCWKAVSAAARQISSYFALYCQPPPS